MKRKHKGSSMIYDLFIVVVVMFLSVWIMGWFKPLATRVSVGNIYRNYKIKMSTDGYLTSENRKQLINDLKDEGCTNIRVIATDKKVKWGENLTLILEYDTTYKTIGKSEGNFLSMKDEVKRVIINDKKLIALNT